MARSPVLNVQVNAQQFTQLVQQFNTFSRNIGTLTNQFNQLNRTMNVTYSLSNMLRNSMSSMLQMGKSIAATTLSITTQFLKWSTIIGGITALLGLGGGLFGIERLASSILARRRQVLGLGGTIGGVRSSEIAGKPLFGDNTGNILANIRQGTAGDFDKMSPLAALGIKFGTQESPDEILNKVLRKIPDILKNAPKGTELSILNAYGLNKIFTDPMDLIRLTTKEGQEEIKKREELQQQIKKELELSPKAQEGWSNLSLQLAKAGAHIQTIFGEKLAKLAPVLERVSQAFETAVEAFMSTKLVERVLSKVSEWLEKFAKYAEEGELEKDLKQFAETIEGWLPTLKEMGEAMLGFVSTIGSVIRFLMKLSPGSDATVTDMNNRIQQQRQNTIQQGANRSNFSSVPNSVSTSNGNMNVQAPMSNWNANTALRNFTNYSVPQFGGAGGNSSFNNNSSSILSMPPAYSGFGGAFGGAKGPDGPQTNISSWSKAALNASPTTNVQFASRGGASGGPLASNNWQSTRTASLVVRNVPGANVFMSGAGMST